MLYFCGMTKCKHCGVEFAQKDRRPRIYCSDRCKQRHFQANKKRVGEETIVPDEPTELVRREGEGAIDFAIRKSEWNG